MAAIAAQSLGDAEHIFDFLGKLSLEYVNADLEMLAGSLQDHRAGGIFQLPAIQFSPRLSARLQFDLTVSETKGILFGLIRKKRSERLADLAIELRVTPAQKPAKAAMPRVQGTWPAFLVAARGRRLHLEMDNGDPLTLEFNTAGDWTKSRAMYPGGTSSVFSRIPPPYVAELLLTLANWVREESFAGPRPLEQVSGGGYGGLIRDLVGGVSKLYQQVVPYLNGPSGGIRTPPLNSLPVVWKPLAQKISLQRKRMPPVFGAEEVSYDFDRLEGRFKVLLDQKGKLATKPFQKGAQRYDIEASLVPGERYPALLLKLWIPDFLVSGPVYESILSALVRADLLGDLHKALGEKWSGQKLPSKNELKTWLANAKSSKDVFVIRTHRGKGNTDRDLFLVSGQLRGKTAMMMFSADLEFSDRDSLDEETKLKDIRKLTLNATRIGSGQWEEHGGVREEILAYLHTVLLTQHHWRGRFA